MLGLVPFVGSGTRADPFRPSNWNGSGYLDLRSNGASAVGFALVDQPTVLATNKIADILDEGLSGTVLNRINTRLGLTVPSGTTVRQFIRDALISPPASRWRALRPRADGTLEIWLRQVKVFEQRPISGGAVITESFNTPDAPTLGPDLAWTSIDNEEWEVFSNQARIPVGGAAIQQVERADTNLATANHYAQANITTLVGVVISRLVGPIFRKDSTATLTYYAAQRLSTGLDPNNWSLYKRVAGTYTQLTTLVEIEPAVPYTLRGQANGSTLTLLVGGVEKLSVTDTEITGNLRCGIEGYRDIDGIISLDGFEARDLFQTFNETVQVGPIVVSPVVRARLAAVNKPSLSFVVLPTLKAVASRVDRPLLTFSIAVSAKALASFVERSPQSLVIIPASRDVASLLDKPQTALVVSPTSKDIAALVDKPLAVVMILPSVIDALGFQVFNEIVQAIVQILPSVLAPLTAVNKPQIGPVVISPFSKDILSAIERPQTVLVISPSVPTVLSASDRPQATIVVATSLRDVASWVDKPQPVLVLSTSVRSTAALIETRQIGPIIILPTVFDTLGALVFNEIVQATIAVLSTARDRAGFVDRLAQTVVITPTAKDARSLIERLSSPFAVVPSVRDIASFVDKPVGAIIVVPSVSDIFTPGGGLAESVLATIRILVGVQDTLVRGPVFSAFGSVHEVSGRILVVSRADGRTFEVSPRGTVREVNAR